MRIGGFGARLMKDATALGEAKTVAKYRLILANAANMAADSDYSSMLGDHEAQ
jgi:hypothetical protein